MVNIKTIRQSNARFANEQQTGLVAVFAGATSGIGANTLAKMVQELRRSTFYVLGRSAARFASLREKLENLNPSCRIVFIQAEVSLVADTDAACKQITAAESKVDFLYMSAGLIPLNGPQYTKEGLETCFAISYYTRIRLVCNLLPLLRQSSRPRVLSVLNGGKEKAIHDQDIGLDRKWSPISVINHTTTMTTVSFERFATNDKNITFMHAYPGLVQTDIFARLTPLPSAGLLWRGTLASIRGLVGLIMFFFGMPVDECGDRQTFLLTTDSYGPGAWRIDSSSEAVSVPGVMSKYGERSWMERIWDHTMRVWEIALANT